MSYILIKTAEQKVIEKKIESIKKLKELCKKEKTYKDLCKKYRKSIDCIDGVSISFCDELETTARTKNGEIFLSEKKLEMQRLTNNLDIFTRNGSRFSAYTKMKIKKKTKRIYRRPNEIEAFQFQLKYQEDKGNVKEYLNDFLDYIKFQIKKRFIRQFNKKNG